MEFRTLPRAASASERRALRRDIRRVLGVSSDPAPELGSVARAIRYFDRLLDLASGGSYRLSVTRRDGSVLDASDIANLK